jgi:hypothetical protein
MVAGIVMRTLADEEPGHSRVPQLAQQENDHRPKAGENLRGTINSVRRETA